MEAFLKSVMTALFSRTAMAAGIIIAVMVLLLMGVSRIGLVNSLPGEQHMERNRDSNRLIITEDKDGCLDMRTLGRSNGVYMSIKPCKPGDKNQPAADQKPN